MNLESFIDELIKVGGLRALVKRAYGGGGGGADANVSAIPEGMIGSGEPPPTDIAIPNDAKTRLPLTANLPSRVASGHIGDVTPARHPIDRYRFNRPYLYRD